MESLDQTEPYELAQRERAALVPGATVCLATVADERMRGRVGVIAVLDDQDGAALVDLDYRGSPVRYRAALKNIRFIRPELTDMSLASAALTALTQAGPAFQQVGPDEVLDGGVSGVPVDVSGCPWWAFGLRCADVSTCLPAASEGGSCQRALLVARAGVAVIVDLRYESGGGTVVSISGELDMQAAETVLASRVVAERDRADEWIGAAWSRVHAARTAF